MTIRQRWRPVRTFAVLVLIAGVTSVGATAWAGACATVDVAVARGTEEPGALGAVVGDRLYDALAQGIPVDSTVYAVRYPASTDFPSSVSAGIADLAGHLEAQAAACPEQRFVLVGYSQGAVVVHGALGTPLLTAAPGIHPLPPYLADRIAAVLLFGDPLRAVGQGVAGPYAGRTGNYCTGGDAICGGGFVPEAHVIYGWSIGPAVSFAAALL
ncbi:cutinase family protein [Nocardia bovistercoris]|uniref:Cutinase family protein n=1 Tax=Nocardia bovistercoris TaxID=2785916 RepID=A0A931I9Z2_9NOCA|nr:cutinase family protein [Nocardia bovistercoris]MBH0776402.1 cutinase family protein [Nocardia bovistercoris]